MLSAVDTGEIYDLVDEMARQMKTDGDTRSMHERRADALVILITGHDPHLGPEDLPPPADPPGDGFPPDPADDHPGDEPTDLVEPTAPDLPTNDEDAPSSRGQRPTPDATTDQDQRPTPDATTDQDQRPTPDATTDQDQRPTPDATTTDQDRPTDDEHGLGRCDRGGADLDDPGPVEPDDLDERDPPDRISELAALALSAMTRRKAPRLPWVAINATTAPDGTVVLVGELQGYGPITTDYATHLLSAGAARAPDEPSGRIPTPAQAARHDPPEWLADEVKARDGTCRYPGCRQPAHRTDLDHTIEYPRGLTVRGNLGALCRRHHRVKGTGCWTVRQHDDGIYEWTSTITSRGYTTYPRGTTGDWHGATTGPTIRAG